MNKQIGKYLLSRYVKKSVQSDLNLIHTDIVYPEFDWDKIEFPEHILKHVETLAKNPLSANSQFEITRFLMQEYNKQLVSFTLAFVESALTKRIKDTENFKLVYCPTEYLVKLNEDSELKEYEFSVMNNSTCKTGE